MKTQPKYMIAALGLTLALVLAACGGAPAPLPTDPLGVVTAYYQAINANDIERAKAFMAEDIVITDPSGVIEGRDKAATYWKDLVSAGFKFELSDLEAAGSRVTSCFKVSQNAQLLDQGCTGVTYVEGGKVTFDGLESAEAIWVVQNYLAALNAKDLDIAMTFVADEAVYVNPYGKFAGKDEVRASLQAVINDGVTFEYTHYSELSGRVVYHYKVFVNGEEVETGTDGLNIVKGGKIVLDSTERWEWMAYVNNIAFGVEDSGFTGPETAEAGWAEIALTNNSQGIHHIQLVKLNDGKTPDDLKAALEADPENFPAWGIPYGGPNAPDPGSTTSAIVWLDAGNYAIISVIPNADGVPGFLNGMLRGFTVTEAGSAPNLEPQADLAINLTEFALTFSGEMPAGQHVIQINNQGLQVHEAVLVKLNDGATADDFLNTPPTEPPPAVSLGGITGIVPGATQYISVTLEPGNYALFCFFPDPGSHAPHFVLGMMREFTVK